MKRNIKQAFSYAAGGACVVNPKNTNVSNRDLDLVRLDTLARAALNRQHHHGRNGDSLLRPWLFTLNKKYGSQTSGAPMGKQNCAPSIVPYTSATTEVLWYTFFWLNRFMNDGAPEPTIAKNKACFFYMILVVYLGHGAR